MERVSAALSILCSHPLLHHVYHLSVSNYTIRTNYTESILKCIEEPAIVTQQYTGEQAKKLLYLTNYKIYCMEQSTLIWSSMFPDCN